jgi:3-phenylpropionate/trans-cinnamate dioxygenase ferredoxin reductase component
VLYLRSVEDSDALRERMDRSGAVVAIGAGWIGAEVAACARQRGLAVTVIDPNRVPLERSSAPRSAPSIATSRPSAASRC